MIRVALLALVVLAASAAPSQARCRPVARARVAAVRAVRVVTAPVRFVLDRRPAILVARPY